MKIWTLIDIDKFTNKGNKSYIDFETAMKNNEMPVLGDCMLATIDIDIDIIKAKFFICGDLYSLINYN